MKKIVLCFITLFLLSACSSNKTTTTELNHEEVMKGDFSSVAGVYENIEGKTYEINEQGVRSKNEYILGEIMYDLDGFESLYLASLKATDNGEGGCLLIIFPIGIPVPNLETDTTKVRIGYGQVVPYNIEEIYYRK